MSNQQEDTATVSLRVDSWRTVQAVLLRESLRLEAAGMVEDATEIVTSLVPEIDGAADSPILTALAVQIQEDLTVGGGGKVVGWIG